MGCGFWLQGYFYYIFGFCFVVGMLTVLITVEVAIVCTYVQLCAEDYLWWCVPSPPFLIEPFRSKSCQGGVPITLC